MSNELSKGITEASNAKKREWDNPKIHIKLKLSALWTALMMFIFTQTCIPCLD